MGVFMAVMGFTAFGYGVMTLTMAAASERMAAQKAAYEADLDRLRQENARLIKERAEVEAQLFHGGVMAAALVGVAVAVKQMR
jgi:cell division protein FtsB